MENEQIGQNLDAEQHYSDEAAAVQTTEATQVTEGLELAGGVPQGEIQS